MTVAYCKFMFNLLYLISNQYIYYLWILVFVDVSMDWSQVHTERISSHPTEPPELVGLETDWSDVESLTSIDIPLGGIGGN